MNIVIDVDNTVCQSDQLWKQWLYKIGTINELGIKYLESSHNLQLSYDLSDYFDLPDNIDSKDFYRYEGIYDWADPLNMASYYISLLAARNHHIIFASHIKGNHHKSKFRWLERNFPREDINWDFVATKEKHLIAGDVIIDDRIDVLNRCSGTHYKTLICMNTPYEQFENSVAGIQIVRDWVVCYETLLGLGY